MKKSGLLLMIFGTIIGIASSRQLFHPEQLITGKEDRRRRLETGAGKHVPRHVFV